MFSTPPLVEYNEMFVTLKDKGSKRSMKQLAVLWHEAIMGRCGAEVVARFCRFLSEYRDKSKVSIFTDNCQT